LTGGGARIWRCHPRDIAREISEIIKVSDSAVYRDKITPKTDILFMGL
jgi:hypothetical protein